MPNQRCVIKSFLKYWNLPAKGLRQFLWPKICNLLLSIFGFQSLQRDLSCTGSLAPNCCGRDPVLAVSDLAGVEKVEPQAPDRRQLLVEDVRFTNDENLQTTNRHFLIQMTVVAAPLIPFIKIWFTHLFFPLLIILKAHRHDLLVQKYLSFMI